MRSVSCCTKTSHHYMSVIISQGFEMLFSVEDRIMLLSNPISRRTESV